MRNEKEEGSVEEEVIIIKKGKEEVVVTDKRISELASQFIEMCANEASIHEDFGMGIKMIDVLIKAKSAFFPATMKNINVNVENFDGKIERWMKARTEMQKAQEEGIEVFEVK